MLREKSLVPLSRQHQHALALCVRVDRAALTEQSDLAAWQTEIAQHFRREIQFHFAAEEQHLFPAARVFAELNPVVEELLSDHAWLRTRFAEAEAGKMSAAGISEFAQRLSAHIRVEERRLFERLQKLMSPRELASLGEQLDVALQGVEQACILPAATVRKG
ncbi:MAG TPA: hemerythrin domain-containing protein [Candidatus Dormibacteraeota bacterium]|nr:hemerythrin domain-containing protein [Candidatus Dormibacteraeota bacterium]